MTDLRGRSHIKIDPKGRISLPAQFRHFFNKTHQLVVTNSVSQGHRLLDLYSLSEWKKLEAKVNSWPALKAEVQNFRRFYISSGESCELDAQGRVLIPAHLRDYAKLKEDIVVVGMQNRLEIWEESSWNQVFKGLTENFEQILSQVAELKKK